MTDFVEWGAGLLAQLHWGVAVLTVAAALLWTRVFRSARPGEVGFWIGIAAGALTAWLYSAWVFPNLDVAIADVLYGMGLGMQPSAYPQMLLATLIDQVIALAALAIVYVLGQVRAQPEPVIATGQGLGIGYAAYVLQLQLAPEFAGGLVAALWLPALAGALLLGVHLRAGTLLALGRIDGSYLVRVLQAGALVLIARYLVDLSDPAWQAAGLAVVVLLSLLFGSGAGRRRSWGRR